MSSHQNQIGQQEHISLPEGGSPNEAKPLANDIGYVVLGTVADSQADTLSSESEHPVILQTPIETTMPEHNAVADKYTEKYRRKKDNLEKRKESAYERLSYAKVRVPAAESRFREQTGREPKPGQYQSMIVSAERGVARMNNMLAFLRPSSAEDIAYRLRVLDDLGSEIRSSIPDGLPLRFHGTEIYDSRDVISSGNLSSSVDRLGYATSYDVADQVSVTTAETIETTLGSYTGLTSEDCCLPAGCVFVVMPTSCEEAEAGRSMLMGNIDFAEQPDRLIAVLTSPENLAVVKQWMADAGHDSEKVNEFFAFADKLKLLKQAIGRDEVNLQELVPFQVSLRDGGRTSQA